MSNSETLSYEQYYSYKAQNLTTLLFLHVHFLSQCLGEVLLFDGLKSRGAIRKRIFSRVVIVVIVIRIIVIRIIVSIPKLVRERW